jgi:hypothetical protein
MAQIDIPDDPAWRRLFKALKRASERRGRIGRECKVEMYAGKNGVKTVITEEDFSPDE